MFTLVNDLLEKITGITRVASRVIAWSLGAMLLVIILMIAAEVITRKLFGFSFHFVHEYSGYLLAIFTSWGLAHTLFEKAHIRIDIGYVKTPSAVKKAMDVLSIMSLALVALAITWYAFPVLARSLNNGSLSNTSLSTPMWIPHLIWLGGYVWFSFVTSLLVLRAIVALLARDDVAFNRYFSADNSELENQ